MPLDLQITDQDFVDRLTACILEGLARGFRVPESIRLPHSMINRLQDRYETLPGVSRPDGTEHFTICGINVVPMDDRAPPDAPAFWETMRVIAEHLDASVEAALHTTCEARALARQEIEQSRTVALEGIETNDRELAFSDLRTLRPVDLDRALRLPPPIDSERSSLEAWAAGVDQLVAEVRDAGAELTIPWKGLKRNMPFDLQPDNRAILAILDAACVGPYRFVHQALLPYVRVGPAVAEMPLRLTHGATLRLLGGQDTTLSGLAMTRDFAVVFAGGGVVLREVPWRAAPLNALEAKQAKAVGA